MKKGFRTGPVRVSENFNPILTAKCSVNGGCPPKPAYAVQKHEFSFLGFLLTLFSVSFAFIFLFCFNFSLVFFFLWFSFFFCFHFSFVFISSSFITYFTILLRHIQNKTKTTPSIFFLSLLSEIQKFISPSSSRVIRSSVCSYSIFFVP